ncbi:MAG: glycine betaine ABC transporter substrate-binding protein [Myxococcales bacterium]
MSLRVALAPAALAAFACVAQPAGAQPPVRIGSKAFTESVILGEVATRLVGGAGIPVLHRRELGSTRVLWNALRAGEIDAYPEYTGTIAQELLPGFAGKDEASLRAALERQGVAMSRSLGFDDTYAIGLRRETAERLGIAKLSDLARHPALKLAFSHEFMDRSDGWPALRARYGLPQSGVRGLDHDLAYRGLASGAIDATDLYSTDAEIRAYDLRVLEDDRHLFPPYEAVLLSRADLAERAPGALAALRALEGRIDAREMIAMNARAKLDHVPEARVAADFLAQSLGLRSEAREEGRTARLLRTTREHLALVAVSLLAAIAAAVPLGVLSARRRRLGVFILGATGVIQTIPSLALLVFMIPLLGIGARPAVVALFLYSLLPIVRNTAAGLTGIPTSIRDSAEALGLPPLARLRLVDLPMASPSILAGIKTSAVINVGTATLGALIGAGGYGQPILTGIRLDSLPLILEGAVPAAVLALAVQGAFALAERALVPRGLRLAAAAGP